MKEMKILLTGASGFLGKHLMAALLKEGHIITAIGREEIKDPQIRWIEQDLLQEAAEEIKTQLSEIDAVVHLAAIMPSKVKGETTDIVLQNKIMTKNTLSLVASPKFFIFSSSVNVYPYSDSPVDESTPLEPVSDYGLSKKYSEEECLQWSREKPNTSLAILRFSHLYGPADTNTKMIDTLLRNAVLGKKSIMYGGGNDKRTYLFVDDAVCAILLYLERKQSGIFNVGGVRAYSIREVISTLEELFKMKMSIEYSSSSSKDKGNSGNSIVSSQKCREVMGFVPKINLHQGFSQLLPKNILFDLDGPILEVKERYYAVYKKFVMVSGGIPLSLHDYWEQKRLNTPLERLLEMSNCAGLVAEHKKYLSEHREEFSSLTLDKLQPQAKEILAQLSTKYNLYLITLRRNKDNLFRQLEELGLLPFFKDVLSIAPGSESKWKHKVNLLNEHHLQNQAGIIIGDTPTEILAGKKSGLTSIAISNGIRTKELLLQAEPHLIVSSIEELSSLPFFRLNTFEN